MRGRLEFRDVSFAYAARPETLALDGLRLEVLPGKTTALCGASGSGKSTALALMLRLYDPTSGSVCLDGVDLRQLDPRAFRAATALVPQEPTLFSCSVADNIRFGRPTATDAEVRTAAEAAGAAAFVDALPQGFATLVGERGGQLSGGQRQRIAIARAIVRDPKILFLDEATAALDAASQRVVQDSLARLRRGGSSGSSSKIGSVGGLTMVIVAHRLSTIADSDRIVGKSRTLWFRVFFECFLRFRASSVRATSVARRKNSFPSKEISKLLSQQIVMANGKNVEQGTHSELLKNESGAYSALVRLQLEAGEGGAGAGGAGGGEKKKSKSSGGGAGGGSGSSPSSSPSSSPFASPGSSPAGVTVISTSDDEAASAAATASAAASSAASAARAAEGAAAAGAASAAAKKRAAASDAAPEHALGWRRLWALSRSDWPSVLVGVLGSAALGELVGRGRADEEKRAKVLNPERVQPFAYS